MSLTTKDVKAYLERCTGTPARLWSRWAKYKVGSKADMTARKQPGGDPGRGAKFYDLYPFLRDCVARVYGAPGDQKVTCAAVFERDGVIVHLIDMSHKVWT